MNQDMNLESAFTSFFFDLQSFIKHVDEDEITNSEQFEKNFFNCDLSNAFRKKESVSSPSSCSGNSTSSYIVNWETKDDQILYNITIQYKNDWKKIGNRIKSLYKRKVPIYILKQRYRMHKQTIESKPMKFTLKEDNKLLKKVESEGLEWIKLAQEFNGRDPITLRNRYYYLKKKSNKQSEF